MPATPWIEFFFQEKRNVENTFLNVEVSFFMLKFLRGEGLHKDETLNLGFVFETFHSFVFPSI